MSPERLKEILDSVRDNSDLRPVIDNEGHVIRTFCNIGLDRILGLCGVSRMVNKLNGMPLMANDMCDYMRNSTSRWTKVTGEVACARASHGIVVVACQKDDTFNGHGHVAVVYPSPMQRSGSWAKFVPMLNNIGRPFKPNPPFTEEDFKNKVLRSSQCFRKEPIYYSVRIGGQDVAQNNTNIGRTMDGGTGQMA